MKIRIEKKIDSRIELRTLLERVKWLENEVESLRKVAKDVEELRKAIDTSKGGTTN